MRPSDGLDTMAELAGCSRNGGEAELRTGDRVRLARPQAHLPAGEVGRVIGFIRRERAMAVIKFGRVGDVVRVDPLDLERFDRPWLLGDSCRQESLPGRIPRGGGPRL